MNDPIEIVPMQPEHIDAAASLLAEAFLEDLDVQAIIGKNVKKRQRVLKPHYLNIINLYLPLGNSVCALLNEKPAGVMLVSSPEEEPLALSTFIKFAFRMLLHLNPMAVWRGLKSAITDENHRPHTPHYYLSTIGVDPKCQGKGVGSALLSHLNDLADAAGIPICLSSTNPTAIRLYERYGYETVSLSNPLGNENHHMERKPRNRQDV